jgi:transposase
MSEREALLTNERVRALRLVAKLTGDFEAVVEASSVLSQRKLVFLGGVH